MSSFTKTKLKALKESVAKKDWKTTERNAKYVLGGRRSGQVLTMAAQ